MELEMLRFPKRSTRTGKVLSHILATGKITSVQIQRMIPTTCPRDYISGLRKLGWQFKRTSLPNRVSQWAFDGQDGFTRQQILAEMTGLK